jgi:hypothetical protein
MGRATIETVLLPRTGSTGVQAPASRASHLDLGNPSRARSARVEEGLRGRFRPMHEPVFECQLALCNEQFVRLIHVDGIMTIARPAPLHR